MKTLKILPLIFCSIWCHAATVEVTNVPQATAAGTNTSFLAVTNTPAGTKTRLVSGALWLLVLKQHMTNLNNLYITTDLVVDGNMNINALYAGTFTPTNIQYFNQTKYDTNQTWNVNMPEKGNLVAITNTLGGSTANLWLTNVVDGGYFVARILADGTARTVSVTNASGLTLNVVNTNGFSVLTLPQIPITASKLCTIAGRAWVIAGTTNVDLWASVQQ